MAMRLKIDEPASNVATSVKSGSTGAGSTSASTFQLSIPLQRSVSALALRLALTYPNCTRSPLQERSGCSGGPKICSGGNLKKLDAPKPVAENDVQVFVVTGVEGPM